MAREVADVVTVFYSHIKAMDNRDNDVSSGHPHGVGIPGLNVGALGLYGLLVVVFLLLLLLLLVLLLLLLLVDCAWCLWRCWCCFACGFWSGPVLLQDSYVLKLGKLEPVRPTDVFL